MGHDDQKKIIDRLHSATNVVIGGRYQHYKTKGVYVVEKLVVLEASDQIAVAYHDEVFPELTWIREYGDFIAKINGHTARFSLLS